MPKSKEYVFYLLDQYGLKVGEIFFTDRDHKTISVHKNLTLGKVNIDEDFYHFDLNSDKLVNVNTIDPSQYNETINNNLLLTMKKILKKINFKNKINLRTIVDINVIEIYINHGEIVMIAIVNPKQNQKNIKFYGDFKNFGFDKIIFIT